MDLTLSEVLALIEALEAEFAMAVANDDQARKAELQAAFDTMKVLRARATIGIAGPLAQSLGQATNVVAGNIQRLTDIRTILTLQSLSKQTGIGLPVGSGPAITDGPTAEDMPTEPPVANLDRPEPAPAGGPSTFITARKTAERTVVYTDNEGREFARIGGSRSWRNFNPGNIRKGNFAGNNGAIGDDGSFAIFPDRPTGSRAIEMLLRGASYSQLSLSAAINRYAPPSENDTNTYVDFVVEQTGLRPVHVLDDLPVADIRKIVKAIQAMEGWTEGEERAHRPSSGQVSASSSGTSAGVGAAAEWMDVARREQGVSQIVGTRDNMRILEYFRVSSSWFEPDGDETDWCAAFVNFCLETSGHVGTSHPGARSFLWNKKRQFVSLQGPRKFAVAVRRYRPFDDPLWKTGKGHVGFIADHNATHLRLLGGNQGGMVQEAVFPLRAEDGKGNLTAAFVAFMMPVMN